jgi:hypothetical protein
MSDKTILFLYNDITKINLREATQLWLARQLGMRPIIANWSAIKVSNGATSIGRGCEVLSDQEMRPLARDTKINPAIVVHRKLVLGASERLMSYLAQAHPDALISYCPTWKAISSKWEAELCFRKGEAVGNYVNRPVTYLVERETVSASLWPIGHFKPLIFKPIGGCECQGILLSVPRTFDEIAARIARSAWARFVAQELASNPIVFEGRKCDVRVYALITSLSPLGLTVFHEGVARIAASPYHHTEPNDTLAILTGSNYRRFRGHVVEDISITELLSYLSNKGKRVSNFWRDVEALLTDVFACLICHSETAKKHTTKRAFYLTGVDLLLVEAGDTIKPVFLESNYAPSLNEWGATLDAKLIPVHRTWLKMLSELCA